MARLVPASTGTCQELAERFGATVPEEPLEIIVARLAPTPSPAGTTDALLVDGRADRFDRVWRSSTSTRAP